MTGSIVARAALQLLPRLSAPFVVALLAVTIGTNLLDFATLPAAAARPGASFALAALVRVALVFWISFVVQRRLIDPAAGLGPGRAIWPFVLLQILFLVGMIAIRAVTLRIAPPAPTLAGEWLANFLSMALWALIAIRLLSWNAALAVGARLDDLPELWRALRGQDLPLMAALLILVLPFAALHLAFTLIGVRVPMASGPLIFLGVVDGIVSALFIALNSALAAAALRLARVSQAR